MLQKMFAGMALGSILLAGCAHENLRSPDGQLVAEFSPGKEASVSKTPYQATYVLYRWTTPPSDPPPHNWIPEQQVVEMFVRGLDKRTPIGFEKTADGKLLAVAGDEKISLEMGKYDWHIHPSTEYTGLKWFLHETGERTVEVISLPFELAAAALFVPLFGGLLLCFLPMMVF